MVLCDYNPANGMVWPVQRNQSLKLFSRYSELAKNTWLDFFQQKIAINKINFKKEKKNIYTIAH